MSHSCNCGSNHDTTELGIQYSLHEKIDISKVECLNESEEGSGVKVFKKWEDRLDRTQYVESDIDVDPELLFNIPFTGNVKLKGLIIIGDDNYLPKKVKLYKNRPNMLFEHVETTPEQEFEVISDPNGFHEYSLKPVKFSSVHHLSLYFIGDRNSYTNRLYYIGLRGEWTPSHKHGVTICTYEARPLITDHLKDFVGPTREIM